jgi:hypothetical protein
LRAQVVGGQVNVQQDFAGGPPEPASIVVLGFGCSDCDDVLAVDVDLGVSRILDLGVPPTSADFLPGEDFMVSVVIPVPPPNPRRSVLVAPGGAVARCDGAPSPTSLAQVRGIVPQGLVAPEVAFRTPSGSPEVFAIRTPEGTLVLLEVPAAPTSLTYQVGASSFFHAGGAVSCP